MVRFALLIQLSSASIWISRRCRLALLQRLAQNIITDLFSGSYFIDSNRDNVSAANNIAAADPNFAKKKLGVGDGFTVIMTVV